MKCFVIVLIVGLIVGKVSTDYAEDSWEEPNSWGHSSDCGPSVCPVCDVAEDGGLAAFCYKKLISNLFKRNTLEINEHTGKMQKTILFTVTAAQLAVIEKSTDMRNLDTAITEILTTAKVVTGACDAKESESLLWLFNDIIKDYWEILKVLWSSSEFRFISFITGIMMLIWFIHKRYSKNLIAVVAFVYFLFGYFFTYLECNRKQEADKVIAYVKQNEPMRSGWFRNAFNSIFSTSNEDKYISNIQSQTKINLPFCRPDKVLTMYISEMFLDQIELIIEKCMTMTKTFKDSMPFPYNILAMLCVPALFVFLTKLVFKYFLSPSAWFSVLSAAKTTTTNPTQQLQNDSQEDRLTGSNLQLLLQAFTKQRSDKEPLPSGVEVLQSLTNGSPDRKSDESKSDDDDDTEPSIDLDKISQEKAKKDS